MAWGIPSVVGPLGEWLASVPVEGCWPNAQVLVRTDDAAATVVAKGTSQGGRDLVPLVVPKLKAGQRLIAQQIVNGVPGDWTAGPKAVVVGAAPTSHAQLPQLAFASTPYSCGMALWLTGAAPGALVSVADGPTTLGTARAGNSGGAVVGITAAVPFLPSPGTTIRAAQSAPPGFPPLTGAAHIASADSVAVPVEPLPAPSLESPLPMGCESTLFIGGVIDGAQVTVERKSDNMKWTATFPYSRLPFTLSEPFPPTGDRISVTQTLHAQCRHHPSEAAFADIAAAHQPDPIAVEAPCAGSTSVHLENLRPGATLTISVEGQGSLKYLVPPERTEWDAPVKVLPAHKHLTATLEVCGFSTATTVSILDEDPAPPPQILGDLFSCGRALSVGTRPGAYLEVWADAGAGPAQISERVHAKRAVTTVGVFPYLTTAQKVWVRQLACGGGWLDSTPPVDVKPSPQLVPVELRDPVEGQKAVLPLGFVSGAHITVWAAPRNGGSDELIGERDATRADPVIGLTRRLTADDTVWAVQESCGERSVRNPRYDVIQGIKRFVLSPPKQQSSGRSASGKIIVHSAELICRFLDGSWLLVADVENTEPGYDCSLLLEAKLSLLPPMLFGGTLDIDVAAAGGLPSGLQSKGYPSRWTGKTRVKQEPKLQDLPFWLNVLNATAAWQLVPAWSNHMPEPGSPDWIAGNQAPPDPMQLFPPLPTDD
ncbi:hypothetical protein ACFWBF_11610 [Streptomyces sp. NPDC060028]|uniref:hypothetical protein n=1 Tax=Streptomyces sp. NPDC060028 TaxID=3347041 RepID=UPI0036C47E55